MGWSLELRLWVDSSTAVAVATRSGLGKIRHLEVKFLWLQEAVRAKRLSGQKVKGLASPADVLTKPHSAAEVSPLLGLVGGAIIRRSRGPRSTAAWADMED